MRKNAIVCFVFILLLCSNPATADITFSNIGGVDRPVSGTGLLINTVTYNLTVTYNNDGAANPLRVGDLPDADISLARTALLTALNAETEDSNGTIVNLQPNFDTETCTPGTQFNIHSAIGDFAGGSGNWFAITTAPACSNVDIANGSGFAQFSVVPEPSSFLYLGLVGAGVLGVAKLRARRGNRTE